MISISPEYLSAKQSAAYLGIGYSTFRRDYPSYVAFGVVPRTYMGRTGRRFKRSELDRLMDTWRVIKEA